MKKIRKLQKELIISIYKTLAIFVITSVYSVFSISSVSLAAEEDYSTYAKIYSQKEWKDRKIAPYVLEAVKLKESILTRQAQPDVQAFKAELEKVSQSSFAEKRSNRSPILIFVSFSMPKASLKGWMIQAQKINAPIYIRGLINNSFKDTLKAVAELVEDQQGGVLIDPPLFKKYSITQVPAVVVRKQNTDFADSPSSLDFLDFFNSFDVVYGDVTLDYALEHIAKKTNRTDLAQFIASLRDNKNGKNDKSEMDRKNEKI